MLTIGINASRAKSGGALAHLKGILLNCKATQLGISEVHVFSHDSLYEQLPNFPWLKKHRFKQSSSSLFSQLLWEYFLLPKLLKYHKCQILFNLDAGSICPFKPAVTMSRDMLSYEAGEMERFGMSKARLRLIILKYIQNVSFKRSQGVIFLTEYASKEIQKSCGPLKNIRVIPHGISENFRIKKPPRKDKETQSAFELIYVSNIDYYKHQWNVVAAVEILNSTELNLNLTLVGDLEGPAFKELQKQILKSDPNGNFVNLIPFLPHDNLPQYLSKADIFVFASSCENMPNTLIEGMAAGLPIACSDRGPMPEVLGSAGVYFNPVSIESIVKALEELMSSQAKREKLAQEAESASQRFSWGVCSNQTWGFITETYEKYKDSGEKSEQL